MRVLVLGGDGYLGWPTAMHFSSAGDEVWVADNFAKRQWELEEGVEPIAPVPTLHRRVRRWKELTGKTIELRVGDLTNHRFVYNLFQAAQPEVIIHYAEQPSAPYSMQGRTTAVLTQMGNVTGTLNVLFALRRHCPDAHLVKLGSMGEYGTPNIDIEEGYLTVTHNGRTDTVLYPKKPHSFYHLSKVHDSNNIAFTCRIWGVRATDLNQGVVYGIDTTETLLDDELATSFHYDHVFGTVLNRFVVQAVMGQPLSVYGKGGQTRGILNIRDTLKCVELAARNPAKPGEFRVFNQFTEEYSILNLANLVQETGRTRGLDVVIENVANPRVEQESHYYNAKHSKLTDLGLQPHLLTSEVVGSMMDRVERYRDNVNLDTMEPRIKWVGGGVEAG